MLCLRVPRHRLGSAGSLQELEKIWEELRQSTIKSDKKAKEVFLKRKEELSKLR